MPVSQLERYAFSPHVAARRGSMKIAALVSLVVLSALIGSVSVWKGGRQRNGLNGQTLTVYCASGVMPAVSEIAEQYEREFGIHIELHPGSSGVLEQQLKQSAKGDLYIPAGREPFLTRGRDEGYVHEILPLAQFRLVLAVAPGNPSHIESLDDLLRDDVDTAIANEHAAVGKVTRQVLSTWSGWEALEKRATSKPTVTEVATDVQLGVRVNAGLIWDANAKQLGLEIVDVPEIRDHADGTATIAAGV
ncbi:MAG: substrate-binding domain-containing protein, partial [Planctomycetales bacterium]|nr:substrate-binding domain-containing protein [Planctomycetales bacterium]